ncbi:MAG TPA: DNA cytosine methyltransferase [Thermoanaerobaculia bacterium]|jgi:DNA (cytosine-5)-methyltransferase 1
MSKKRPVAIDLFAGAGGLTLGFEQAGFDVLASVEYDAVHAAVHEFNFPQTATVCADVSRLTSERLRAAAAEGWARHGRKGRLSEIDAIFGGPPCQGFSFIGKRLVDDHRNQLVFHFLRVIAEIQPKYFVMENVPGMLAGGHSGILQALIREFRDIGYNMVLPVQVLNAAEYGVPQARRRLFLLGARADQPLPQYPAATCRPPQKNAKAPVRDPELPLQFDALPTGPTVWDAIGDLPDLDSFDELWETDEVTLTAAQLRSLERASSAYAATLRHPEADPNDLSHPRSWEPNVLTSSARTEHTALSVARFSDTEPGETEPVSRFYRLDPRGLCNTLRAGTGSERGAYTSPRPIHPKLPRVISVREAARLHSFPDWFRLHRTKWHGFRQVGNSVPPLLARAVARQIVAALGAKPERPEGAISLGDPRLLSYRMSEGALHFGVDPSEVPAPRQRHVDGSA